MNIESQAENINASSRKVYEMLCDCRNFEQMATQKQVMAAIGELIDAEDKHHPLSDEKLTTLLKQKGYDIARRTIAKYREIMKIPIARMRK